MNISWFKYYIVLCETESFRVASDKIGITSSALSKALLELENYFKVTLVKRKNKFEGLTPAGELLLKLSKNLVSNLSEIESQVQEFIDSEPQGTISIASEALSQNYILPELINHLISKYPKIIPKMFLMITDYAERSVLEGKVDFAILTRKPSHNDIGYLKLLDIPHKIIGKPHFKKNWEELPFIIPRFFEVKGEIFVDGWNDNLFPRKSIIEAEGLSTTIRFCELGTGVAFLPIVCVKEQLKNQTLEIVSEPPFDYHDELFLIWSKNTVRSLGFYKFIEEVKQSFTN